MATSSLGCSMKPFVKWAGGKTQLLPAISEQIPSFETYYEPFLGAGALFLHLKPEKAVVNDINSQLINVWIQIRDRLEDVLKVLEWLDGKECDTFFYSFIRDEYNDKIDDNALDPDGAGMFIWLNKHCFNGLYRVNRHGFFNVPWNHKGRISSFSRENLENISRYLNESDIEFRNGDFEDAVSGADEGDFVYFDSPYVPESITADFTQYAKDGFGEQDHLRLFYLYRILSGKGVKCLLSNNDVPFVREMYKEWNIGSLSVSRAINRNGSGRSGREVLVRNYII